MRLVLLRLGSRKAVTAVTLVPLLRLTLVGESQIPLISPESLKKDVCKRNI